MNPPWVEGDIGFSGWHPAFDCMYKEDDKIMVLDTGEVLTVLADLSEHMERGIVVKERIGRNLKSCEVRPAGRTRERADAGRGIVEPEPFPPPVDDLI